MVSRLFAHSSKAIFRTFRETGGALWLREGQIEPDPIDCNFVEKPRVVDIDGFVTTSADPQATFLLSDIAKIDPARAADPESAFKNERRDWLTINGRRHAIESCTGDGYGWINVKLIGPIEE
ncbi:hypothetical protein HFO32_22145 [Rhizobium leguminosarum]|uniref:hypothetical protein n=1 Tax=Rhizobium leguminosarum TaxID=384 RepID=UPI001C960688|nr:hypothetical protein [Rhizobium leguminosarum]MBY5684827.1 hypothetical protein [Rhizobium leguminosarum]